MRRTKAVLLGSLLLIGLTACSTARRDTAVVIEPSYSHERDVTARTVDLSVEVSSPSYAGVSTDGPVVR